MTKIVTIPGSAPGMGAAVLISAGTMEASDVTTIAWIGTLCSEPPIIGIGVRPSRWLHHFVVETGAFVVNVPDTEHVRELDLCGTVSGRTQDKWALARLTREQGTITGTPMVAECPLNLECQVRETVHLGSHDLFLGEVVASYAHEGKEHDVSLRDPVCYIGGKYWKLGDLLGPMGLSRT
jgi:flavin reductase (DIM6/NTAB) family NADH-FMN oxidoreductase RutF